MTQKELIEMLSNPKKEIKSMQIEGYSITYTAERLQIGSENHPINNWKSFTDEKISAMDEGFLEWWSKWKNFIFTVIKLSPATPNGREGA